MKNIAHFKLNDGFTLPSIGLGTAGIEGAKGVPKILSALELGYRLIDTSTNYDNEGMVGEAIRRSKIPREEITVSSKLPGKAHEYNKAITMIQESLFRLGLDYFDKYLIHWPLPKQDHYVEAWQALIDAQKMGLIKTIGVSNFLENHLERIVNETGVTPATNQIERHPYFNNKELVEVNNRLGILTEAWSPFGRDLNDIFENETIMNIAEKHGKSVPQVILRWNYENRVLSIAKSTAPNNQLSNSEIFDFQLSKEDKDRIDRLDQGEAGRVNNQHPSEYEEFQ